MSAFFSFQAYVYVGEGRPFEKSLEEIADCMQWLPGLYFEWDGSLTWANQSEGWQIDAMVYDDGRYVQYVDLHGRAAHQASCETLGVRLRELLAAWGNLEQLKLLRLPDREWQDLQAFEKQLGRLADSESPAAVNRPSHG